MKRHIISALITFATAFSLAILPQLDTLTLEEIKNGTLWGVLFVAVRAGVKAVFEFFVKR